MALLLQLLTRLEVEIIALLRGQQTVAQTLDRLVAVLSGTEIPVLLTDLQTGVTAIDLTVNSAPYGLHHVAISVDAISQNGTYTLKNILDAIAALPAGSSLVNPTPGIGASDVWDYTRPGYPNQAWSRLESAGAFADAQSYLSAFRLAEAPGFLIQGAYNEFDTTPSVVDLPLPDYADIRPDDTRLSWLTRTDTPHSWTQDVGDSSPWAYANTQHYSNAYKLRPAFTEGEFQSWVRLNGLRSAPVWPGLAGVTLGTPVSLADQLVVTGPLQGVLVDCSTPPTGASAWNLGAMPAYYRWGEVSFTTDNGEAEEFRYLGFGLGVYLPRTMAVAASAIFRVSRLPAATVTPFTIP